MCERLKFENEAYQHGKKIIVGLDEAGRGPMAGPLVVGAVIFDKIRIYCMKENLFSIIKKII